MERREQTSGQRRKQKALNWKRREEAFPNCRWATKANCETGCQTTRRCSHTWCSFAQKRYERIIRNGPLGKDSEKAPHPSYEELPPPPDRKRYKMLAHNAIYSCSFFISLCGCFVSMCWLSLHVVVFCLFWVILCLYSRFVSFVLSLCGCFFLSLLFFCPFVAILHLCGYLSWSLGGNFVSLSICFLSF